MDAIRLVLTFVGLIGGFFFTGKAVYHVFYLVTNVTGKYASFFGPFVLFMPNQFNAEGNRHRVALWPALLGVAVFWGVIFASGAISRE